MQLKFTVNDDELKMILLRHLREKIGLDIKIEDIKIEVKSKQNFRSEWELADFRATYEGKV